MLFPTSSRRRIKAQFALSLSVRPIKLTNAVVVLAFRLLFKGAFEAAQGQ